MPTSLILFYDGQCPLCVKEMTALKKHDTHNAIQLVDIFSEAFEATQTLIRRQPRSDCMPMTKTGYFGRD